MSSRPAPQPVNSAQIVEKLMRRASKQQLVQLVESAVKQSGEVVLNSFYEPGDELCPTFRFPFPLPHGLTDFLTEASRLGTVRLFPYGILNPEAVLVQVGIREAGE